MCGCTALHYHLQIYVKIARFLCSQVNKSILGGSACNRLWYYIRFELVLLALYLQKRIYLAFFECISSKFGVFAEITCIVYETDEEKRRAILSIVYAIMPLSDKIVWVL